MHLVDINYLIPIATSNITRGHHERFLQPPTTINSYLNSFFPSAIKIWNFLPNDTIESININQFKQSLAGLTTI